MKPYLAVAVALITIFTASVAKSEEKKPGGVLGGFEMAGFLNAGFGWQRFSNDPITEFANDGSYAGVLGSVISNVGTGAAPAPGQDDVEAFMEVAELDITKTFGERATLRADLYFGRPLSGSWVPGTDIEQAYLTVMLWKEHALEFTIGRFGTQAGFEAYEPYNLDTISWSLVTRANLYPFFVTGAQLSFDVTDYLSIYLAAGNGVINDTNVRIGDIPAGLASFVFYWGEEPKDSYIVLTPFIGPESGENRPLTYGADATFAAWLTNNFQLALEGVFHHDNAIAGGVNTNYLAGFMNLRWEMAEDWYGVLKYTYVNQLDAGNGVHNLTGAKQQIHEAGIGFGYNIADGMKLKWEGRVDIIAPKGGSMQWVPGTALALACAF
ncbi:MAG: outer membrane beta-barrel protein [bacterium]